MSSFIEFHSVVSEVKLIMSQPIRGRAAMLLFSIGPKNTKLVDDVDTLLPVKLV